MTWNKSIVHENCNKKLLFRHQQHMAALVSFHSDYMSLCSDMPMISDQLLINIFIVSKSNEMWLGVIPPNVYRDNGSCATNKQTVFYYSAKEHQINLLDKNDFSNLSFDDYLFIFFFLLHISLSFSPLYPLN